MSATRTVLEALITLGVVAVAAVLLLLVARRAGVRAGFGAAQLVGHLPLEPRRAIYLVRVGERVFVVGASEAGMTTLGEVPAADVPKGPAKRTFADAFAGVLAQRRAHGEPDGASEAKSSPPEARS